MNVQKLAYTVNTLIDIINTIRQAKKAKQLDYRTKAKPPKRHPLTLPEDQKFKYEMPSDKFIENLKNQITDPKGDFKYTGKEKYLSKDTAKYLLALIKANNIKSVRELLTAIKAKFPVKSEDSGIYNELLQSAIVTTNFGYGDKRGLDAFESFLKEYIKSPKSSIDILRETAKQYWAKNPKDKSEHDTITPIVDGINKRISDLETIFSKKTGDVPKAIEQASKLTEKGLDKLNSYMASPYPYTELGGTSSSQLVDKLLKMWKPLKKITIDGNPLSLPFIDDGDFSLKGLKDNVNFAHEMSGAYDTKTLPKSPEDAKDPKIPSEKELKEDIKEHKETENSKTTKQINDIREVIGDIIKITGERGDTHYKTKNLEEEEKSKKETIKKYKEDDSTKKKKKKKEEETYELNVILKYLEYAYSLKTLEDEEEKMQKMRGIITTLGVYSNSAKKLKDMVNKRALSVENAQKVIKLYKDVTKHLDFLKKKGISYKVNLPKDSDNVIDRLDNNISKLKPTDLIDPSDLDALKRIFDDIDMSLSEQTFPNTDIVINAPKDKDDLIIKGLYKTPETKLNLLHVISGWDTILKRIASKRDSAKRNLSSIKTKHKNLARDLNPLVKSPLMKDILETIKTEGTTGLSEDEKSKIKRQIMQLKKSSINKVMEAHETSLYARINRLANFTKHPLIKLTLNSLWQDLSNVI